MIGDPDKVMEGFTSNKAGGDSMFGDVLIRKGKGGQILLSKKITGQEQFESNGRSCGTDGEG